MGSGSGMRHRDNCWGPLPGSGEINAFESLPENPYGHVQSTTDVYQIPHPHARHPFLSGTVRTNFCSSESFKPEKSQAVTHPFSSRPDLVSALVSMLLSL